MNDKRSSRSGKFTSKKELSRQDKVSQVRRESKSDIVVNPESTAPWFSGRRIVELDCLAKGLEGCEDCGNLLDLNRITDEKVYGFGSLLYVECECGFVNNIHTGKTHRAGRSTRGIPIYDVNTKAATGMIHSGIGETHVNGFMAALNVPTIYHKTLKAREREAGIGIERVANMATEVALEQEIQLSQSSENTGKVNLTSSYDMGWQRRSSGRAYNSKSGHGCLFGQESGKITSFGTRILSCRVCDHAQSMNKEPSPHDCRKNWSGSSKAMEADLAVQLINENTNQRAEVGTIIMDDDSTTMSKIRKEVEHDINKISDINHTKKSLGMVSRIAKRLLYCSKTNLENKNKTM